VKEQTAAYLEKSRELLGDAEAIFSVNRHEAAARTAYLAGFHAAQAFIFETNERIYKTHSGMRGEFTRLVRNDPRVDDEKRAFLGRTYDLKAIADYETGPGSHISAERAREAIDSAKRFVECIAGLLPTQQSNLSLAERFGRATTHEADPEQEPDQDRDDEHEL
jgi:uncharacterized protein (UPF0332 family)